MKTTKYITITTLFLCLFTYGKAQNTDCVQCSGNTVTGTNASAIGKNNTASGNNAFAGGYNSIGSGSNSFAFGYNSKATQATNIALGNTAQATGIGATAIGAYVKASAQNSYVIGSGTTTSNPLNNTIPYSIALGVNSNKPTMLITKALNNNYTGKVAIGPVTTPQAKFHIKSDTNEDAGVFIEPSNKAAKKAFINLFDTEHNLTVEPSGTFVLNSGSGCIGLAGNHYCFGSNDELKLRVYTNGAKGLYYNARQMKDGEVRDGDGPSYGLLFRDDHLCFRTAVNQSPRGAEITNWNDVLRLGTDGRITLNGNVGINTDKMMDDYALAVNGGIISTKVYIKEANQWPDYVFADDYRLLSLEELGDFIATHHHLPGVPSEDEISRQGYDLHQMQCILMEKIEEMSRYILELKEEIDSLKSTTKPLGNVQFTYDACGRRTSRSLTVTLLPDKGEQPTNSPSLAYDLFPNPTQGLVTLRMKTSQQHRPVNARLLSSLGNTIESRTIQSDQATFDLSSYANGIYLLEIETREGTQSWKIVKQ